MIGTGPESFSISPDGRLVAASDLGDLELLDAPDAVDPLSLVPEP